MKIVLYTYFMEKQPREKTHTKPLQKMITTGSALLFFGGIGLLAKGSFDSGHIQKELDQRVPTVYSVDTLQQARGVIVDFQQNVETLILDGNTKQIADLAEKPEIKHAIEIDRANKQNQMKRLKIDSQLREKKHPYEKVIVGIALILIGGVGITSDPALSEKQSHKNPTNTRS